MEKMTRQLILQKYHLKSEKCMGLVSRKILIVKIFVCNADFFNIFLKLLVYSFLAQLVDPTFLMKQDFTKHEINRLFSGDTDNSCKLVDNFFETHF